MKWLIGENMCSSPKSSGNSRPRTTTGGFTSNLSTDALSRFAACANAADERRQLRQQQNKAAHHPSRSPQHQQALSKCSLLRQSWKYWLFEAKLSVLFNLALS